MLNSITFFKSLTFEESSLQVLFYSKFLLVLNNFKEPLVNSLGYETRAHTLQK